MRRLSIFLMLVLTGCAVGPQKTGGLSHPDSQSPETGTYPDRKIVITAAMELESEAPESLNAVLAALAMRNEGYILSSGDGQATLRIPFSRFYTVLDTVAKLGEVVHQHIEGREVTEAYYDISLRLESTLASRRRYLDLLARTQTIEDALRLERELERLNTQIDQYQGQMNRLAHLVDFATLTVRFHQAFRPGPIGFVATGLLRGIRWLFVRG